MSRRTRWTPALAALSVVLSAAIGVVINVATDSARLTVVVAATVLVCVAAGLAWLDGRAQLAPEPAASLPGIPAQRLAPGQAVLIRHAPTDRTWARWVRAELVASGIEATLHEASDGGDPAQPLMTIASRSLGPPSASTLAHGPSRRIVVRVDDVRLPPSAGDVVDLAGLSEDRAREALLIEVAGQLGARPAARRAVAANPVPFPGTPPRVWSVPPRNPAFVGREAALSALRQRLAAGPTVVVPEALYGLGGVGKTQTAIEYAHRFATDYDLVWWVSAEEPGQVRLSLASLAARLGIPTDDGATDSATAVLDVLRQGRQYARWLLVFDNAEDPADLNGLLPQGSGHVLITSRSHAWVREASAVEMSVFDREESVALLHRRVPNLPDSQARAVADKLGDLPLAIEQAGAWLATSAMPVERYLDLLDTQPTRTLDDSPPSSYGRAVSATWLLSLERLRTATPAAGALLDLCACFAPEPIPLQRLLGAEHCLSALATMEPAIRDPLAQAHIIREIGRSALARVDPARSTLQIHRLVRAVVRTTLGAKRLRDNQRLMWRILAELNPRDSEAPANSPVYADLWPHLSTADLAVATTDDERALVTDMTRHLWVRGDYRSSQNLAEAALAHWQPALDPADRAILQLRLNLGNAMRSQGRDIKAHEYDAGVYADARRVLGEDDRLTIHARASLASALRGLGDYRQGHRLDSENLARCRRMLAHDDRLLLMARNNLAVSLRWIGDFRAAAILDKDTLETFRARFPDRGQALTAAHNYGTDLRWIGRLNESLELLERSLAAGRRTGGASDPRALLLATNLAVTLHRLGDDHDAQALTADTLARCAERLGPDHRLTLANRVNLSCEQSALGDHVAAHATATATLARYHAMFGEAHPLSLTCANNVALFLYRCGDPSAALAAADRVAGQFRDGFGDEHPYTLAAMVNLANAAYTAGQVRRARDIDEETYARSLTILGDAHHQTLSAAGNLATSRHGTGARRAARALRTQAVETANRVLGARHPVASALRSRLRLGCDLEPQSI